jgi:hypothetical protein
MLPKKKPQEEEYVDDGFVEDYRPLMQDADGNFTPRSAAKIERIYHKIKDDDDVDIKPWER